jgi:hypothetical protein
LGKISPLNLMVSVEVVAGIVDRTRDDDRARQHFVHDGRVVGAPQHCGDVVDW